MKKTLLIALLASTTVMAQTSSTTAPTADSSNAGTSTIKAGEVSKGTDRKDIDQEITNARMRAELGSKSKWSFKSSFAYSGGSIERPFAEVRPEYRGTEGADAPVSLAGDIGINYRLGDAGSLSLSTGISVMTPFHGDYTNSRITDPVHPEEKMDRFQISTPSVSWSRGYKAAGLQMSSTASVAVATEASDIRGKNLASISFQQAMIADLNTSLSAGVYASVDVPFYSGERNADEVAEYGPHRNVTLGLIPFMEYSFNDTVSLRTVFGWFYAHKFDIAGADAAKFTLATPYQSVGVGLSVTRDVYLYPNLQFTPFDIRTERTNVAMSAIINAF